MTKEEMQEEMRKTYTGISDEAYKTFQALNQIAIDVGFGNKPPRTGLSEMGAENFAHVLLEICKETSWFIKQSHKQGLGYDATRHIARRLHELVIIDVNPEGEQQP